MPEEVRGIAWEAYEHHHVEKKSDWYWIVGIIIVSIAVASVFLGNALFGIAIMLGGFVMLILAARPPRIIPFAVTQRGIRVADTLYPYTTLEAYYIDEENTIDPELLVRSEKLFMPLLVLPLPGEYVHEIEAIISQRLPEEHLQEPFANKLLEFFGF